MSQQEEAFPGEQAPGVEPDEGDATPGEGGTTPAQPTTEPGTPDQTT